ncbi:MAG: hypothetical protein UR66_C0003G0062 [Candidatus Moranbacteria bacterium GW2011_GWE1_35_17]|nr:MAG: hypothetical protein UR65_C0083G0001 [Candidatus Moranbacteria bacterium GW2011_GWE2_35_164]KKP68797.1 MAG: hypothetical protein UR66_C0003G0062 [Candidatus Moranbacteria bacterium GW2011_GWE1_35_17]KKP81676.1 MAG: hypothetical protein UR82_C0054G0006 [Candidatus Moranbacteria bacterium GW2011_GWF1_35_5]
MTFGNFKAPKNTDKYYWTRHSVGKMMQYGLSAQRAIRVIRSYQRIELGVAKNTVAVMQPVSVKTDKDGKKKWSQEIWVMYQSHKVRNSKSQILNLKQTSSSSPSVATDRLKNQLFSQNQLKIISVWRYPGVSPKNNPIPSEILEEVGDMI